jgi:protein PhnA
MTDENQTCPKCDSPYGYKDGGLWVCPECFHEWSTDVQTSNDEDVTQKFLDVNGVELHDGDSVVVAKDLKAGGSTIKSGTKVRNIKLLDSPVNGHDISCKIDGMGSMYLKCSVVRKA